MMAGLTFLKSLTHRAFLSSFVDNWQHIVAAAQSQDLGGNFVKDLEGDAPADSPLLKFDPGTFVFCSATLHGMIHLAVIPNLIPSVGLIDSIVQLVGHHLVQVRTIISSTDETLPIAMALVELGMTDLEVKLMTRTPAKPNNIVLVIGAIAKSLLNNGGMPLVAMNELDG